MSNPLTGIVGALIEAWAQLRVGRLRVMLSLVGVGVAVAAMTFVIAFGQVSATVQDEILQQWYGRPGTVQVTVTPSSNGSKDGTSAEATAAATSPAAAVTAGLSDAERVERAYADFVERYQVSQWAITEATTLRLSLGGSPTNVQTQVVTGGYGMLHRTQVMQGRWFTAEDEDDLSPSILVNQATLDAMGVAELTGPLRVHGLAPLSTTYTIVGVLRSAANGPTECYTDPETNTYVCGEQPTAMVLAAPYYRLLPAGAERAVPALEVWAGAGRGAEMETLMTNHFTAVFGHGSASTQNNEFGSMEDFNRTFTTVVTGAGVFIMLLGALGLVNISMVTVRQRIHEIGVRRAFGATSGRIFFSIMLESVVATVVAGVIGIGAAVVAMRLVPMELFFEGYAPAAPPPFPMSAALIGLAAATGVGALAGLVPAIVAVRIRPIDAIRF